MYRILHIPTGLYASGISWSEYYLTEDSALRDLNGSLHISVRVDNSMILLWEHKPAKMPYAEFNRYEFEIVEVDDALL